jgi:hypothetical protein
VFVCATHKAGKVLLVGFRINRWGNSSQVLGSPFRVKDKEGIEDSKTSLKRLVFPSHCQFESKFWVTPDEGDAFV